MYPENTTSLWDELPSYSNWRRAVRGPIDVVPSRSHHNLPQLFKTYLFSFKQHPLLVEILFDGQPLVEAGQALQGQGPIGDLDTFLDAMMEEVLDVAVAVALNLLLRLSTPERVVCGRLVSVQRRRRRRSTRRSFRRRLSFR